MLALLLLLGLPAAPPEVASPGLVRAVHIEAEGADRFRRLVPIERGQPLDPEAVRRAVELLFATGRFEDVLAEIERGPEGIEVILRARKAPLLRTVRVSGERVLSANRVQRLARLREGEPLWPRRLERAGRDVALALQERGHLEALVEAVAVPGDDGAEAHFHVHAGPRVRVGRATVIGAGELTPLLQARIRPRPGEPYRRQKADEAAEAMRRVLVATGRWRAAVRLEETYEPDRALMALDFVTEPGPRVRVSVSGALLPASLLDSVRTLVRDGGASGDALEAGAERIEIHLRGLGHREAVVRADTETDPAGEAVVFRVEPGDPAVTGRVELRGASAILLEGVRTRPGRPVEDRVLDQDARLIAARLTALGHFDAQVEAEVPDGGGLLDVRFLARPGPRCELVSFEIEGPPLPQSAADGRAPQELSLRVGAPYRVADVAASRAALVSSWQAAGHLDARVDVAVVFTESRDQAQVRMTVQPGPRTLVGQLVVAGLDRTRERTVRRELTLQPGQPFSFERVLESQRRLSGLGIFERVSIAELDPTREQRDVVVSALEAPTTAVSWGVGYSEQDLLRGSVELTRRNLGGVGRTASAFARGSFRGSRLLLNLREPWLFGRKLDSFFTAFWEEEDRRTFDYNRKGITLQAARPLDAHTSLIVRYLLQDTRVFEVEVPIEEIDRQYRTYTVSGPSASLVFDTRDDPLEPRRGVFFGADAQLSLAGLGGESYLRGMFQGAGVRRLHADLVLVLSARMGLAGCLRSNCSLPLPERFFAGGDYGPRGFRFDSVGPYLVGTDGERYPTGGQAMALGGAELRYNVTRAVQVAGFVDLGNVYPRLADLDLSELRRTAGVGLRYRTPIGPIRLDWGYLLDPQPDDATRSRFHLTIGHAF